MKSIFTSFFICWYVECVDDIVVWICVCVCVFYSFLFWYSFCHRWLKHPAKIKIKMKLESKIWGIKKTHKAQRKKNTISTKSNYVLWNNKLSATDFWLCSWYIYAIHLHRGTRTHAHTHAYALNNIRFNMKACCAPVRPISFCLPIIENTIVCEVLFLPFIPMCACVLLC